MELKLDNEVKCLKCKSMYLSIIENEIGKKEIYKPVSLKNLYNIVSCSPIVSIMAEVVKTNLF